jgi:rRNA maturation endonuclease Nob1
MIRLSISDLIFFYILFSVVIILIVWIVYSHRKMRSVAHKEIDYIRKCSVCLNTYVDSKYEDISLCPLCGSYNKTERKGGDI